ncbi:hypothetical protein [Sphingomicrobium aestuariivivum]|uniref:hypothetical protein n=1 Tax=Sphingomicrobium aestuariivivum TaxID=1582356 RepID=UPI001FD66EBC|nr:hypothetical protein [Sphingomicrobium aestuariivivum]MCJ8189894.1 hypothetical protein [Sphingomicrobium aestuariivivum]
MSKCIPLLFATAALALASCGEVDDADMELETEAEIIEEPTATAAAEPDATAEAGEEATADSADSEDSYEVCDEDGNRYPSEQAAKDAGLEEAQYGATYCDYL